MNKLYKTDINDITPSSVIDKLPNDYLEKNSFFEEDKNEIEDFEFNQDFDNEDNDNIRSPGWIRYQKRIK